MRIFLLVSLLLSGIITMQAGENSKPRLLDNNRNNLPVLLKWEEASRKPYLDFNFLAEESNGAYRTNQEIAAYIAAYPEMLKQDAVAEKVKARYPQVFQEAMKQKEMQQQERLVQKRQAVNNK